jgi:hypothetical protein
MAFGGRPSHGEKRREDEQECRAAFGHRYSGYRDRANRMRFRADDNVARDIGPRSLRSCNARSCNDVSLLHVFNFLSPPAN